jgi:hypothetical protein
MNSYSSKLPKTKTTVGNSLPTSSVTTSFSMGYTMHQFEQNLHVSQPSTNMSNVFKQEPIQEDQVMSVLDQIDIPGIMPTDISDLETEDLELFLQN